MGQGRGAEGGAWVRRRGNLSVHNTRRGAKFHRLGGCRILTLGWSAELHIWQVWVCEEKRQSIERALARFKFQRFHPFKFCGRSSLWTEIHDGFQTSHLGFQTSQLAASAHHRTTGADQSRGRSEELKAQSQTFSPSFIFVPDMTIDQYRAHQFFSVWRLNGILTCEPSCSESSTSN